MSLNIIGAGVGRTGTYSLKLAINRLGLGPCFHMEAVLENRPVQVPLWRAAIGGAADWEAIYRGYNSAVDWPTAGFFRELHAAYPSAKFILTHRSAESWAQSFAGTIYKLIARKDQGPEDIRAWLDMGADVIARTGFPMGLDHGGLMRAFTAHNEAVKATVPAEQLLVYEISDGWEPLCRFLDVPIPDEPFPRTNDRSEFWDLVASKS